MNLTKNFTLEEFINSDTAKKYGIDNTPGEKEVVNLKSLCENLLQPVRELFGKPMKINSGFRSEKLNKAVNGSSTSDHRNGYAADVAVPNPKELHNLVLFSGLPFDQLILYPTFVHMSFNKDRNRRMVSYDSAKSFTVKKA